MDDNYRVNLQYSIALKELPGEVTRLIEKATAEFNRCYDTLLPRIQEGDEEDKLSLKTCAAISETRISLAATACTLEDIENIIQGYVAHKAQDTEAPAPSPAPTSPAATPQQLDPLLSSGALDELSSKLRLFQEQAGKDSEKPHPPQSK